MHALERMQPDLPYVWAEVEFAEAILYAIDNGISIVNCSCAFFNVGRGDGTGTDFSNDPAAHVAVLQDVYRRVAR